MNAAVKYVVALLLLLSLSFLLFAVNIYDFDYILPAYLIAFLCYFIIIKKAEKFWFWIVVGFLIRAISIYAFPSLSDDIYRFIWDGWLITEGINPFSAIPTELKFPLGSYQEFLLDKMNSPDYYSVYPPLLQAIFALTVKTIPTGAFAQSVMLKLIMLSFETITVFTGIALLNKLNLDRKKILIYFLNPLVIIELMGNLHMELIMISAFAVFLYFWQGKKITLAAAALSLSVSAKLLTILVTPFLLQRVALRKLLVFSLLLTAFLLVLFTPMFYATYENLGKGLNLYFQKFEFNASIYYILRQIGFYFKGYNIISSLGPTLALVSAVTILVLAWKEKAKTIESLCTYLTISITIYFCLSTTVHPWYVTLLVFMSIFSNVRYTIYWSLLAVLSYAKYYQDARYYLLFVGIEYSFLFSLMLLEYYQFRKNGVDQSQK